MASLLAAIKIFLGLSNEERIRSSERTWTQLEASNVTSSSNRELFKALQKDQARWGEFFHTFREGQLVKGDLIAEGGQAQIYEAKITCFDPRWDEDIEWVLKVFKIDCSLEDLQRQWPEGMFKHHVQRRGRRDPIPRYNCDVQCGTLLEDGSFAFLMEREEADLRILIDQAMKLRTSQDRGPFLTEVARSCMHQIAKGMLWLHDFDIIHRDLKAANVLVREICGEYNCFVADYECSVGILGTGFHRAPEILRAIKDKLKPDQRELLITKKADVYSYGMTCYEILTGKHPFEDRKVYEFNVVLDGNLPKVPPYVEEWACELLRRCWEFKPEARPSFQDILNLFSGIGDHKRRLATWTKLVTEMLSMYMSAWSIHSTSASISGDQSESDDYHGSEEEIFEKLQKDPTWGAFFLSFTADELLIGKKFAEGGQADLFYGQIKWQRHFHNEVLENPQSYEVVLKVFKKRVITQDLQRQWPLGMLEYCTERIGRVKTKTSLGTSVEWDDPINISIPLCGTLLSDGRFAFVLLRKQGDLRNLIERTMMWKHGQDCGPFSEEIAEKIMHDVANGVDWLHRHNIIHRDLKSSNVLFRGDPDNSIECFVADFECSVGVVGTGFWRAPEILQSMKERVKRPNLFSEASDVYSYGMTCYEILTGHIPFEELLLRNYDLVISGGRPDVPNYVNPWARGLLSSCWESNPEDRPSMRKILDEFAIRRRGYVPPAGL